MLCGGGGTVASAGGHDDENTIVNASGDNYSAGVLAAGQQGDHDGVVVRAASQNADHGGRSSRSSTSWASSDAGSGELGHIAHHERRKVQPTIGKVTVTNDNGNSVQVADTVQNINIHTQSMSTGHNLCPYIVVLPPGTASNDGTGQIPHVVSLKDNSPPRSADSLISSQRQSGDAAGAELGALSVSVRKARMRTCLFRTLTIVLCAGVTAVFAILPFIVSGGTGELSTPTPHWSSTTVIPLTTEHPPPTALILVKRREWGALPARRTSVLKTPVDTVIIQHTETDSCVNETICIKLVASLQRTHFDRRYDDITYNFLVGGDGIVYEGRGWETTPECGARWNHRSLCMAVIGDFTSQLPTAAQRIALMQLLAWGEGLGKTLPDYRLCGKCQLSNTTSPGAAFMAELRKWKHWYNHTAEKHHRC